MDKSKFQKSDMEVQAAWKGFSSQTFYIAARLILVIKAAPADLGHSTRKVSI